MFCQKCGAQLEEGARFCTACGNPVVQETHNPVESSYQPYIKVPVQKKEFVFNAAKGSGIINLVLLAVTVFAAAICIFSFIDSEGGFYEFESRMALVLGIVCIILALQNLLSWIARSKVELYMGSQNVTGITVKMWIFAREFEYAYNEISEVTSTLGLLQIRADGKWVRIPGIENRKMAKKILEERISGVK